MTRNDTVIVIGDEVDNDGNPIMVALKTDGSGTFLDMTMDSNFATSIYGKDSFYKFIANSINAGKLIYVNKNKSQSLNRMVQVQFLQVLNNVSFDTIIHKSNNIVNRRQSNPAQRAANGEFLTKEEINLNAEYMTAVNKGDVGTAQKIVEEVAKKEGYTQKVYHGSPETEIKEFDIGRAGKATGAYQDKAIWVSNSKEFSSDFSYETTDGSSMLTRRRTGKQGKVYELFAKLGNNLDMRNLSTEQKELILRATGNEGQMEWLNRMLKTGNHQLIKTGMDYKMIKDAGYDSITAKVDINSDNVEHGLFDANRLKSADVITYDDNGNVIPILERFNEKKSDIRYSLADDSETDFDTLIEQNEQQKEVIKHLENVIKSMKQYNPSQEQLTKV